MTDDNRAVASSSFVQWLKVRRDKHHAAKQKSSSMELKKHHGTKARVFKEVIDYVNTHVIVAQRIEHGDSTSDHAGSIPADDANMSVPANPNYDAVRRRAKGTVGAVGTDALKPLNNAI